MSVEHVFWICSITDQTLGSSNIIFQICVLVIKSAWRELELSHSIPFCVSHKKTTLNRFLTPIWLFCAIKTNVDHHYGFHLFPKVLFNQEANPALI